ncbi:hypothetical protein DHBDCA_p897 [Dehalobacter sp. DCA]|nr:hypothetical protein DHBDCA_p897 [Dehalobacter sp. DCA]
MRGNNTIASGLNFQTFGGIAFAARSDDLKSCDYLLFVLFNI